jgi:hypothetical protein
MNWGQGILNMAEGNEGHLNKVYVMVSIESEKSSCTQKQVSCFAAVVH